MSPWASRWASASGPCRLAMARSSARVIEWSPPRQTVNTPASTSGARPPRSGRRSPRCRLARSGGRRGRRPRGASNRSIAARGCRGVAGPRPSGSPRARSGRRSEARRGVERQADIAASTPAVRSRGEPHERADAGEARVRQRVDGPIWRGYHEAPSMATRPSLGRKVFVEVLNVGLLGSDEDAPSCASTSLPGRATRGRVPTRR